MTISKGNTVATKSTTKTVTSWLEVGDHTARRILNIRRVKIV